MLKCNNSGSAIAVWSVLGLSIGVAVGHIAIGIIVGFVIGMIINQLRKKSTAP